MFVNITSHRSSWQALTYNEVREVAEKDGSIFVLPVGSVEQHGNHLPVSTDSILVTETAFLGADRVNDEVPILIGPTVWSGYSPHHLYFGGTLSLQFAHLLRLVEDLIDSALQNGFDAILLLNGHGGNTPLISSAVSTIGVEHPEAEVLGLTYFELAKPFIEDIRESEIGGMAHGGEFETSLMLFLQNDLVKSEREGEYLDEPYELGGQDLHKGGPLNIYRPFEEYSPSGAIGDPNLASSEKGEEIFQKLGDEFERLLRTIYNQNLN